MRIAPQRSLAQVFALFLAAAIAFQPATRVRAAELGPDVVAAAKKEGRLTFYTPLIVDQVVRPLVAAFRAKYGIQVEFVRMDSSAVVLKVLNEYRAKRPVADAFTTSLGIEPLIAAGSTRAFRVPGMDVLPAGYKDPNNHWAADRVYVLEPAVNTKLVAPADRPKSYDDLLDPKWAGKMAWRPANLTGSTGFIADVLMGMGEEKGMDYLRKLARQKVVTVGASDRAVLDQIIAGEYPMALAMTNHNVEISRKDGAPLAWMPLSPAVIFSEQIGLTALATHPNAALLFADFVLSREGQTVFQKAGYIPSRPDVPPLDPKLLPAAGGFKANVATPEYVEKNYKHWDDIYRQLFR
jgi:iron(III) transport system substrate-binding protein